MALSDLSPPLLQTGFVVLAICMLLQGIPAMRRMREFTSSARRLSAYKSGALSLWTMALGAVLLAGPVELLTVRPTGAGMAWLAGSLLASAVAAVVVAAYFSLAFGPALHCMWRPAARQKYCAGIETLRFMLPVSSSERLWWILVSISAGVCEELFFRGFMPKFLSGELHGVWTMAPAAAWLLSSVLFGLCHFYQGAGGIVRTAVGGLMFSLLAILTGHLLLPIVLHILVDLAVLWMYRPETDDPAAAARLIQGCTPEHVAGGVRHGSVHT